MTTPQRYAAVVEYFSKAMPVAESELEYTDPFQLLVFRGVAQLVTALF